MPRRTAISRNAEAPRLRSPLARLSLPQETRDSHHHLAWANSICALVLALGLVGLAIPRKPTKVPASATVLVPVRLAEIIEQPDPDPAPLSIHPDAVEPLPPSPEPASHASPVLVVAAVTLENVRFPVPINATIELAPRVELASPPAPVVSTSAPPHVSAQSFSSPQSAVTPSPTPVQLAEPQPARFNPAAQARGFYPSPAYPAIAVRNRWEGTVVLLIEVNASGEVARVELRQGSGHGPLDDAAVAVVKTRWRFPAGARRIYLWDCTFRIQ